jgi:hypothetical protein
VTSYFTVKICPRKGTSQRCPPASLLVGILLDVLSEQGRKGNRAYSLRKKKTKQTSFLFADELTADIRNPQQSTKKNLPELIREFCKSPGAR